MASAAVQLLVFDSRRGGREGEEADALLGGHPAAGPAAAAERAALVGLLHGLLLFAGGLTGRAEAWHTVETDHALWALAEPEPHIYFALAAARAWLPRHAPRAALGAALAHAHQLVQLLHGPVQALLDADPSGADARAAVGGVLAAVGGQLECPASRLHRALRSPLGDAALAPALRASLPAALEAQSLCNQALSLDAAAGGLAPEGAVVLHDGLVVWSTLAAADTAALYSLLAAALLEEPPGMFSAAAAAAPGEAAAAPSILAPEAWERPPSGWAVLRARRDGPPGAGVGLPPVHAAAGGRRRLLPLAEGRLLLALLLPDERAWCGDGELAAARAALAPAARALAARLAADARAAEPGHVPGWRYMARAAGEGAVRASPRDKVSSMSHEARALAAAMLDSLELVAAGDAPSEAWAASHSGAEVTVCAGPAAGEALVAVQERRGAGGAGEPLEPLLRALGLVR